MNRPDSGFGRPRLVCSRPLGEAEQCSWKEPRASGWFAAVGGSLLQEKIVLRVARLWTAPELGRAGDMQRSCLAESLKGAALHTPVLIELMI